MASARGRSIVALIPIVLLAAAAVACVAYPLYVIWPFRYQAPAELSAALRVVRIGPWLSIVCAALSLLLVLAFWRSLRGKLSRSLAIASVVIAAACCYLSRVNIYEMMFHPAGRPQFEAAEQSKIDPGDMVIAVRSGAFARAYPIREMAYHHVINDTFAGEPIVATY